MSHNERSKFYEFKTFIEHLEICGECQTKLVLDELFGEVMTHAEQTGSDEMQKEEIKQNRKLMGV